MRTKIQNIDDLREEVIRLGVKRSEMETDLKIEVEKITSRIRLPLMLLRKLNDFLGGSRDKSGKKDGEDWVSGIFRIGLPVMMNRFLFPKSGFIVKSVIELISQNAAKTVNKDLMSGLLEKLSEWIKSPKTRNKKEPELADYGIPPDSETY
ncbi:hypothetical protein SAMN05421813_10834 [Daejeonella rubra]|uniref:Uncharacterized protein n=1 Tax=Daejeonella rubra TaxID=990371 RepID=A0A1G9RI83_9SPHI|nr:hypothetical protein [Daejeonella rubra]SDM23049.1 hypothetical protein SAMN05421813_10834 [Daejeonella rubra]